MSSIIAGITKDLKAVPENLKAKAKGADAKKLLLLNVPYILAGYFCDKVAVESIGGSRCFRQDDCSHERL